MYPCNKLLRTPQPERSIAADRSPLIHIFKQCETSLFRRFRREPPRGLARAAFWLLVSYLLLGFIRFLPHSISDSFQGLSVLVLLALIIVSVPLLWHFLFHRVLWKVRNRLIVTYLLMGLAPLVLFALLALISLYMFSGQFAIFAATAEISTELEHLASENRSFAMHLSHVLPQAAARPSTALPELDNHAPDEELGTLHVSAFLDGKRMPLAGTQGDSSAPAAMPVWGHDRFRGIVLDGRDLYLRAIDIVRYNGHTTAVITSVPLEKSSLDKVAHGLGAITVIPSLGLEDGSPQRASVSVRKTPGTRSSQDREIQQDVRTLSITGGKLPSPEHFYDITVRFYAPLETTNWATGQVQETLARVNSRPSLLYKRLFITSLKIAAIVQDTLIGIAIFFGIVELVAFYMAMRLNRTITRSVNQLYRATVEIDQGNLTHRINVTRHDQLAALARSFNRMSSSLERLLAEQREKERLQSELAIAQEVQANLFPRGDVSMSMLDLHGVCYPARTVSGDYYDFLVFADARLGLAIGDISGKGISAALLMATLHSAVRAYRFAGEELLAAGVRDRHIAARQQEAAQEETCGELFEEPAKILSLLNRHLYRSTQPEKYATLFLAHYDGASQRLVYSNGGQLPPLLLRADDSITRLDCGGTVVGLLDGVGYEQATERLHPGDILIAYSDGVTEPENEFGEFGEDRLIEVVRRHKHMPLDIISEQVMQSLRSWIGGQEQPDDITLVLARQR